MESETRAKVKLNQSLVIVKIYLLLCVSNMLCPEQLVLDTSIGLLRIMKKNMMDDKITENPKFGVRVSYLKEI